MNKGQLLGRGRTADVFAWGDDKALKLFGADCPLKATQRELATAKYVELAGLPVPHVEPDIVELEGRSGIVYERICGPSMLHMMQAKPWKVWSFGRLMAELHFAIHRCPAAGLASYCGVLRWSIEHTVHLSVGQKDAVLKALSALPDGNSLCHCDFHPDNIILTDRGPRIIDWMTAAQGDALADVARTSMMLRLSEPPDMRGRWLINFIRHSFFTSYIDRYLFLSTRMRHDIDAWLLPTMAARLNEDIPGEPHKLLGLIEQSLPEHSPVSGQHENVHEKVEG